jgi:hypothetical protein
MPPREGADPVRAQEFRLVQHHRQDAAELLLVDDGQHPPVAHAWLVQRMQEALELGPLVQQPVHPFHHLGQLRPEGRLDDCRGAERQQADDGAHLQPLRAAVGPAQDVIEEAAWFKSG